MGLVVRFERPGDEEAIREVNISAFPTPVEAKLVDALRTAGAMSLSLVAEASGKIVGHLLLSRVSVEGCQVNAVGLGPVAVARGSQRKGVGTAMMNAAMDESPKRGFQAVFVLGHHTYYPRFGFIPASRYGLRFPAEVPDEAFMAREFVSGSLFGAGGLVRFRPEFDGV